MFSQSVIDFELLVHAALWRFSAERHCMILRAFGILGLPFFPGENDEQVGGILFSGWIV